MKKLLIAITLFSTSIFGFYIACIEKVDDGYIINISDSFYDPIGTASEVSNLVKRDCSSVKQIDASSSNANAITNAIFNRLDIGDPKIKFIITFNEWAIIESEFSQGEPLSFLIRKATSQYEVIATWGGSAAPFKTPPAIRSYFSTHAPAAPIQLLQCYDPVTPPFTSVM